MKLAGIEKALGGGCLLNGFRSGGGLRVIRIEKEGKKVGYGEHPSVEDALSHANEDFLAGGRPYKEVYGIIKPHYLTGSQQATSPLDAWILRGRTIDARAEGGNIIVELNGYDRNLKRTVDRGIDKDFFEAIRLALEQSKSRDDMSPD